MEDATNTRDHEEYMNDFIDQMFRYNIWLRICKRLKSEEDRVKLESIRRDLLETERPTKEVVEGYFKYTDKIEMCESNIAYTNETCKKVANEIRRMKQLGNDYIAGDRVICKKYLKLKKDKWNANITYEIMRIDEERVVLKNITTEVEQTMLNKFLKSHFVYAYCKTAHSKQGCSVNDEIIRYDWQRPYCRRKWIWVAITRCRDLSKVRFYKYDVNSLTKEELHEYFNNTVKNYMEQDREAKREMKASEYVNVGWLKERMKGHYAHCGDAYVIETVDGVMRSNLTANRLDNNYAHHNVRLCVIYAIVASINYHKIFIIMSSDNKDEILSSIYYDRSGYGSVNTTYQDAKKKDKTITVNDVQQWFEKDVERKKQLSGYNSFVAPYAAYEYAIDLFFITK